MQSLFDLFQDCCLLNRNSGGWWLPQPLVDRLGLSIIDGLARVIRDGQVLTYSNIFGAQ